MSADLQSVPAPASLRSRRYSTPVTRPLSTGPVNPRPANNSARVSMSPNGNSPQSQPAQSVAQPVSTSDAAKVIEIAKQFSYFHAPDKQPFARIEVNGHTEVWPVSSSVFTDLLEWNFYRKEGRAINHNSLNDALGSLRCIA